MRSRLFVIFFLSLIACRQTDKSAPTFGKNGIYSIVAGNDSTEVITWPCAISLSPAIEKLDRLKQEDSVEFYVAGDDNSYYMYEAEKYLDSLKTKIIQKESKGTLYFKTKSGQKFEMKLDSLYWGMILFNGKTKPVEIDITNIESEYKTYMKK